MISVMNDDAEFDKRSDEIEEKARVSSRGAIDSSNEENRLNLGVSNEEPRVSSMELDSKDVKVSENERSEEVRESDGDSVVRGIGSDSTVFNVDDRVDEQNDMVHDDENDRIENLEESEKDTGSEYKSLLSEFDDYVANVRIGGGTSRALSYGFEVGDMVWGKVKSHPWWPGHIFNEAFASPSVRRTRREGHVLVAFFGDSSYGWFDPAELVPFDHHFMEKSQQTYSRTFVKAVEEAMDEASRRRALGLACKCRNPYNFRPTNVQGYFAVDVPDYEPNGVYSVNQIRNARNSFKPSETLSFVKQLASAPEACDQQSIEFIKNKATVFSFRKAVFEEFDETYAQAFGVQAARPSNAPDGVSNQLVKQTPRAPLSGPLVIAEALGGGKSSKKPIKVKDHSKKDRYLFKRRDEASDLQAPPQICQAQSSSSMQSTCMEGLPTFFAGDYVLQKRASLSQIPVKQEQTIFMSRDGASSSGDLSANEVSVNQTSAHDDALDGKSSLNKIGGQSTSFQQEGDAMFDFKPEETGNFSRLYGVQKPDPGSTAKLEGGQGLDQVRDGHIGGHHLPVDAKRSGGMHAEVEVKKAKKRPSTDIVAENSALRENKKKRKKKEVGSETNSDKPKKAFILGKGGAKSAQTGFGPREESQVSHQKKDVGPTHSSFNSVGASTRFSMGNSGLELAHLLSDLHALALDPFHGIERTNPTIVQQFFLRFRSLVYQKSLVLSPPLDMEPVEVRASKPHLVGASDNFPNENISGSTPSKPVRALVRPDDPTKAGRKRLPSDRQEEIAAKRLKKILQLKSLAAEKKGNLRTVDTPKVEGKEQPTARPPARPFNKLDSARKMEPPPRAIEPTMLVMKFPPQVSLPSVAELKARFGRFGSLDQSAIRVFWKSSTCRVVFRHKIDAQAAYRYANGNNSLFGNVNVRYHLRSVEAPTAEALDSDKTRGDDTANETIRIKDPVVERPAPVLPHQPLTQPTVQLKSCLKMPTNDEAGQAGGNGGKGTARVKFMLGGDESSRGEQLMVGNRNNFNNNASFADGAAPSVAMEFNSKNFQKVILQSSSPSPNHPLPQHGKALANNLHPTEVSPRMSHNLNTQTSSPPRTTTIDISQQMLSLLTRCNDVVTNVTGMLGYVPYHPL